MQPDLPPITPARVEWRDGAPCSTGFGDVYFSRDGGVRESRAVFLHGCRLEERFAALRREECFVLGETGFGTGLNLLLAAQAFARLAPPEARLALVSVEKHPLPREDLDRALAMWPELAPWARALSRQYPSAVPGMHRIALAPNIDLTLMLGDAEQMWRLQPATVDAWFLDGFAPARNPGMWTRALCECLARRSRPGATLASFSVAGAVREALAAAGFEPRREPGFGRKRQRLEGRIPGDWRPARVRRGRAGVIGAGLAGCTSARALAERGWSVEVLDAAGVAAGASGNRAGVVYTTPSGHATPQNRFYQSSFLRALAWFDRHDLCDAGIGAFDGVLLHPVQPRQRKRLLAAPDSGYWPASELVQLDGGPLLLRRAGWLRPPEWCGRLLDHPEIQFRRAYIATLDDALNDDVDALVIATAGGLPGLFDLPVRRIRGQVTEVRATQASRRWDRAECHHGYLTPAVDGLHCVGATFDLNDDDKAPRAADDAANLEQLRRWLPRRWEELGGAGIEVVGRRVGFRCQARDYLPIAGPAECGPNASRRVWLNLAHGSRGISGTPLTAELLADRLSGLPAAIDRAIEKAISPQRFSRG